MFHTQAHISSHINDCKNSENKENQMSDKDNYQFALAEAKKGRAAGGIPIGGALVVDGKVIAVGHNQRVQHGSAIHHAEMNCLENAGRLPATVYQRATMYTTLSPMRHVHWGNFALQNSACCDR